MEAITALRWLKAAGFPQYCQMFLDGEFPINLDTVERDHDFLGSDLIQPLLKRLRLLNEFCLLATSASRRLQMSQRNLSERSPSSQQLKTKASTQSTPSDTCTELDDQDDDDEMDQECALSDRWRYQLTLNRWSRRDSSSSAIETTAPRIQGSPLVVMAKSYQATSAASLPVLQNTHTQRHADSVDFPGDNNTPPISVKRSASDANSEKASGSSSKTALGVSGTKISRNRRQTTGITPEQWDKHKQQLNQQQTTPPQLNYLYPEAAQPRVPPTSQPRTSAYVTYIPPMSQPPARPMSTKNLRTENSYENDALSHGMSLASLSSENRMSGHFRDQIRYKEISTVFRECASILQNEMQLFGQENDRKANEGVAVPPPQPRNRGFSQQLNQADVAGAVRAASRHSLYDNLDDIQAAGQRAARTITEISGSTRKQSAADGLDDILAELQNSMDVLQKSIDGSVTIHDDSLRFIDDSTPAKTLNVTLPVTTLSTASSSNSTTPSPKVIPMQQQQQQLQQPQQQQQQQQSPQDKLQIPSKSNTGQSPVTRERHDSGVGSSITRSPNEQQRRHRVRWHSFQKNHVPGFCSQDRRHISCMTAGQLNVLRKVALLNLTAVVESQNKDETAHPSQTADLLIELNNLMRRALQRTPMFEHLKKGSPKVFGAPLSAVQQMTGQPLPLCILHAMRYVLHNCKDSLGIFRRSGVRTRILQLKEELENNPERTDFEGLSPYDVADLIKQYFRDLPQCLFTSQLSGVMLKSPPERWLEVIEHCLLLLPDENRQVLHCLLLFLHDVAQHSDTHQMTASNLAICFAPSLFSLSAVLNADAMPVHSPQVGNNNSNKRTGNVSNPQQQNKNTRKTSTKSTLPQIPDHRELMQQKTAHECLALMITNCQRIFTIPEPTMRSCRFSYIDQSSPLSLTQISELHGGFENYLNSLIHRVTKASKTTSY